MQLDKINFAAYTEVMSGENFEQFVEGQNQAHNTSVKRAAGEIRAGYVPSSPTPFEREAIREARREIRQQGAGQSQSNNPSQELSDSVRRAAGFAPQQDNESGLSAVNLLGLLNPFRKR